jgi:hypothetical protein
VVKFAFLKFHSHRGLSPVTTQFLTMPEPFQRFAPAYGSGKVDWEIVETVPKLLEALAPG